MVLTFRVLRPTPCFAAANFSSFFFPCVACQKAFDLIIGIGVIRDAGKRVVVFIRDCKNYVLERLGEDLPDQERLKRRAIGYPVSYRIVVTVHARDGKLRRLITVKIRAERIDQKLPFGQDPRMRIIQADTVIGIVILLGKLFGIADIRTPTHGRT